eukprot:CAMPEP_0177611948 /NCGR_PEP_ID=MMETSP0419_2-20121207/20875_1 /TAXON_ID=582737 /ORGANISM="Tetraselmis sp., Strain GSL018" /LENGTH=332 /DNA_ID=CAMNT_0019107935 /DNA_START=252 /DNA_END=1250 /DNA_ORIENTATION=-
MTWGVQNTEDEAHQQLSFAKDMGINFLDTAEIYPVPPSAETAGDTDRFISSWLKEQKREDVILATKVAGASERLTYLRENGEGARLTRSQILESVDKSLARLGTDYIDLLQLHWPDRYVPLFGQSGFNIEDMRESVPFEEQLMALDELIKAGKVRHIGVSNETSWGVMQFCRAAEAAGLPTIVSIQNAYSLIVRVPFETDLAETCAEPNCNVGLLAYSPLAGGVLTGKYIDSNPEKARLNVFPGYMARYKESMVSEAVVEYAKVAEKYGLTPTELALAWCHSRWFVTSTIIGATSMDQLKHDINAFSIELPEECVDDVNKIFRKYRDPSMSS